MKVIDSVGWIEYFAAGPLSTEYGEYLRVLDDIITPTIVMYEVYKKILRDVDRRHASIAAAQMMNTQVVPLDSRIACSAAEYSYKYRLPMADAIVYATAQAAGAIVITSDQHFQGLPDVEYIAK